jgi:hypothetical protein
MQGYLRVASGISDAQAPFATRHTGVLYCCGKRCCDPIPRESRVRRDFLGSLGIAGNGL